MVDEAAKRLGRLDILINNAGMNIRKQPQEFTLDEWKLVMDTNLTSAFVASQAAYPHMKRAGGGKIVNIGSMMSIFGASFITPYAASKGGIVQMTSALATAWARDNIQVNAVLPGLDRHRAHPRRARARSKGLHESVLARTPAGRWGEPRGPLGHRGVPVLAGLGLRHRHGDPGRRRLFVLGVNIGPRRGPLARAPHPGGAPFDP